MRQGIIVFVGVMVLLLSIGIVPVVGYSSEPNSQIPYKGDEIALIQIKAHPEQYIGKTFIICGGLQIVDSYGVSDYYWHAQNTHYSLYFRETGKNKDSSLGDSAQLFLSKRIGAEIVDAITKVQKEKRGEGVFKLARVKVTIIPAAYYNNNPGESAVNVMEVLDVQFIENNFKAWGPWIVEKQKDEAARIAREQADAEQQAAIEQEKAKKELEAAKWRTWTDSTGKYTTYAKYSGIAFDKVTLIKQDGSKVQLPLDKLSDEDREWVANRSKHPSSPQASSVNSSESK